jgi:hypothetical protein
MRRPIAALLLVCALSFWLFIARGAFGLPGQWVLTPNARFWPVGGWLLPLGVVLLFGGAAALSVYDRFRRAENDQEKRNSTLTALFCLAIVAFLWPWALLGPGSISQSDTRGGAPRLTLEGRFNIIAAQWSDVATEYFGVAHQIQNPREFGREYAQKWQNPPSRYQAHVATHPPGAVLWFYGARRVYEGVPALKNGFESLAVTLTGQKLDEMREGASVLRVSSSRGIGAPDPPELPTSAIGGALWTAFLLGLSLVLAIPAVYGLAHGGENNDASEIRGLFAVGLWILAPTFNLFAFTLDALVATGTIWTLFLFSRGLQNSARARIWMFGAGAIWALTSFLSFGALSVGAILVLTLAIFQRAQLIPRILEIGAAFLAVWLVLALVFAFNPLEVFFNAMREHRSATLQIRSWILWIPMNLVMWAPFAGFALIVCLFRRGKPQNIGAQIGWCALLTLLFLSFSGNVRGEVERLWLFLLAPIAIYAASGDFSPRVRAALLGLQALQTLLMAATLAPLVRP